MSLPYMVFEIDKEFRYHCGWEDEELESYKTLKEMIESRCEFQGCKNWKDVLKRVHQFNTEGNYYCFILIRVK